MKPTISATYVDKKSTNQLPIILAKSVVSIFENIKQHDNE